MAKQKAEMSWKVLERELAFILGTWAWQAARLLGESLRQALTARPEDLFSTPNYSFAQITDVTR